MVNTKHLSLLKNYAKAKLDIVVAGTKEAVMMVEAGANECSEEDVVKALEYAQKSDAASH